jgi:hypothetical protein
MKGKGAEGKVKFTTLGNGDFPGISLFFLLEQSGFQLHSPSEGV